MKISFRSCPVLAVLLTACSCFSNNNSLKGYEWIEGEWYGESDYEAVHLIVTQHYYQMTRWSDDETEEVIWDQERIPIEIKVREFSFSEPPISSLSIGYGIFISKKNRCLFTPLDEFVTISLAKVADPIGKVYRRKNVAVNGSPLTILTKRQYKKITKDYSFISDFKEGRAIIESNGLVGFVDNKGTVVVPPKYSCASPFFNGYARVADSFDTWGIIDMDGDEVVPPQYNLMKEFGRHSFIVYKNRKYGFIKRNGTVITAPIYDSVSPKGEGLYITEAYLKYGLVNSEGREIVPPKYIWIGVFEDGVAQIQKSTPDHRYAFGLINKEGEEVLPPVYSSMGYFYDGLARVSKEINGRSLNGYINRRGEVVVPLKYTNLAIRFTEGLSKFSTIDNKIGYIDTTGKEVILLPDNYVWAEDFKNGYARVKVSIPFPGYRYSGMSRWGFIDKKGKEVVPPKYLEAEDCSDGLAKVALYSSFATNVTGIVWGFVNMKGEEITPFEYYDASSFSDGLAAVQLPKKGWGYINTKGEIAINCQFYQADPFSCGRALVREWNKKNYYFIDTTGAKITSEYSTANSFSEGLASVLVNDGQYRWGFIDTSGQFVIYPSFKFAGIFSEGLAAVDFGTNNGASYGYIDQTGTPVIDAQFNNAKDFHNGVAEVVNNGRKAYIDKTGRLLGYEF